MSGNVSSRLKKRGWWEVGSGAEGREGERKGGEGRREGKEEGGMKSD